MYVLYNPNLLQFCDQLPHASLAIYGPVRETSMLNLLAIEYGNGLGKIDKLSDDAVQWRC